MTSARRAACWVWVGLFGLGLSGPASAQDVGGEGQKPPVRPPALERPIGPELPPSAPLPLPPPLTRTSFDAPLGFAGPSGILPREGSEDAHFVPIEDRWRIGFPEWDRHGQEHPLGNEYPYTTGHPLNPYRQNVLKGDYPIVGQHTFLNLTASAISILEPRQLPTPTTPFESTQRPFTEAFFGRPNQYVSVQNLILSLDLFHGDAGFKPIDWRVKVTPIFNINNLDVEELAIINPDVRKGTTRGRTFLALQEWFVEAKLADLSPDYDFASVRLGSQPFTSDFRGFLFSDTNRGARLFGTLFANRDQFNLVAFDMLEKDTNSELNSFHGRDQYVFIANYYRQDFLFPGYTAQASIHYNKDLPSFRFDQNNNLVRPDPVGVAQPHEVNVAYLGWAGSGHIGRYNVTHQLYWALGRDSLNPLANRAVDINAQMAAAEVSYDRDWMRFRSSLLWASGDDDINNAHACGFDTILDNPRFAGGEFSFWQRQAIKLFGVNLVNRQSLVPDLRSSKIQGQANFVNPGLWLLNFGVDMDLTPKLKMVHNVNLLWFESTKVLEPYVFQGRLQRFIGTDLSVGFEYRPLLHNNVIVTAGVSGLVPGAGFKGIYNNLFSDVDPMAAAFLEVNLTY